MEKKTTKRWAPIMRHGRAWLAVSVVVVVALWIAWPWLRLDGSVRVAVGDDLAALAADSPPGTLFRLTPGRHAAQTIHPKDGQIFDGNGVAVLSGAVPLTGFANDGGVWRVQGPSPIPPSHGTCDAKRWPAHTDGCRYREALFVDNWLVPRVFERDAVDERTWFQDRTTGEIVIGFDPAGRTIELSHTETAFDGDAAGVVVRGLTVEKFASLAQHGAIQGDRSRDWRIEDSVIRFNSGAGVRIGDGMRLVGNRVLANGQAGIVGIGNDVVVDGNDIGGNNTHGYSASWEAGGTKFVKTERLLVMRNCVHDNGGPGLWTDIDNRDARILDNITERNAGAGIFHEISGRALIADNRSIENGTVGTSPWTAQILVSGSVDTTVERNRVVVAPGYGQGIFVVQEGRPNESKVVHNGATYAARGNVVARNEIQFLGERGAYGYFAHGPEDGLLREHNRFEDNAIVVTNGESRFVDDYVAPPPKPETDDVAKGGGPTPASGADPVTPWMGPVPACSGSR